MTFFWIPWSPVWVHYKGVFIFSIVYPGDCGAVTMAAEPLPMPPDGLYLWIFLLSYILNMLISEVSKKKLTSFLFSFSKILFHEHRRGKNKQNLLLQRPQLTPEKLKPDDRSLHWKPFARSPDATSLSDWCLVELLTHPTKSALSADLV